MDKNTLDQISQDQEFIKKLVSQETDQGFKDVLGEKGINISLEDANEIRVQVSEAMKGNLNLTDKELEIISGGDKDSVGDAIKYAFKTTIALALVAGTVKFGIDVSGNIKDKQDNPTKTGLQNFTGIGKDKSTYGRAVDWTADALINVVGGKGEENRCTKDIKHLTGQKEESEEIVKGFGLKNGKLF